MFFGSHFPRLYVFYCDYDSLICSYADKCTAIKLNEVCPDDALGYLFSCPYEYTYIHICALIHAHIYLYIAMGCKTKIITESN